MEKFQAIRYLNNRPVRAVYDKESLSWWYSAMDLISALTGSNNGRRYWNTFKVRHFYNYYLFKQIKVKSNDLKEYTSDVLNEKGIALLFKLLRNDHIENYDEVLKEIHIPFNDFLFDRCNHLLDGLMIDPDIIFSTDAVIQIQNYLFDSLDNKENIFRNPLAFDDNLFIKEILLSIDFMESKKIDDLINKFIEFYLLKPFNKGNLISGLIWLDLMIRIKFKQYINYKDINSKELQEAINESFKEPNKLYDLINASLLKIDEEENRIENVNYIINIGKVPLTKQF